MNKIIKANGEYITSHFSSENGTWELIGTVAMGEKVMDCQDTFFNRQSGIYQTVERAEVYECAERTLIF
ncbi:hypothetical protein [Pedobacter sp. L105]|uniref:hypothetical protein n=1 Tax=Pedobacter sp. L105 TaxID=1641871 RepID=UPI00131E36E1|nr:hypothetical protein [Pedobacter sp. L105]